MYGINVGNRMEEIRESAREKDMIILVGAEKVPMR